MKQKIILLFANPWSLTDEDTGELRDGVSCYYYINWELSSERNRDGSFGSQPAKSSAPIEVLERIKSAPAVYDATFVLKTDRKTGKGVLNIEDLEYCYDVDIMPILDKQGDKASDKPADKAKAG